MPPLAIAAGIGAIGSIGGAMLSGSAAKKAANRQADTAQNVANQNNALQREVYGQNKAMLDPFVTRGNQAGDAINSLLGVAGPGGGASGTDWAGYVRANPDAMNDHDLYHPDQALSDYGQYHYAADGSRRDLTPYQSGGVTGGGANNAFQNYLGSTGYQFQKDQGEKSINQGYAAKGSLQSGAAMKALQTYGQNTATGFFKDYLGLLSNQQGVGLSGASAVAGVGQGFANSVSANNNNAGAQKIDAYGASASAQMGTYGAIAGGVSGVANAFGSSYGRASPATASAAPVVNYNALGRTSSRYFG